MSEAEIPIKTEDEADATTATEEPTESETVPAEPEGEAPTTEVANEAETAPEVEGPATVNEEAETTPIPEGESAPAPADGNVATEEGEAEVSEPPDAKMEETQAETAEAMDTEEPTPAPANTTEETAEVVVPETAAPSVEGDQPVVERTEPAMEEEAVSGEAAPEAATEGEDKEKPTEGETPAKETKKRVRRVGRTPTRKIPKLEEKDTPSMTMVAVANETDDPVAVDAATAAVGAAPETAPVLPNEQPEVAAMAAMASPPPNQGVLSKHDEKWHAMFQKLLEYKARNKNTLVPQCYTEDPRLGRWVHYQRVEFWIFQQKGSAKITEERIARLNNIGFEWDPQKAQWEKMFEKLKQFKKEHAHCRVPKGYDKDWELANWVRNQRLEQANLNKHGKKSRMTPERYELLNELGFKWSSPTPARARRSYKSAAKKASNGNEQKEVKPEEPAPTGEKAAETEPAAEQGEQQPEEAIVAATDAVGTLATEGESGAAEESTKADAGGAPIETEASEQIEV